MLFEDGDTCVPVANPGPEELPVVCAAGEGPGGEELGPGPVEPGPVAEVAEAEPRPVRDEGCGGGPASGFVWLGALGFHAVLVGDRLGRRRGHRRAR